MNELDLLLIEYVEKFNENFPIFLFRGKEDDEIISTIKKCIEENKVIDEIELDNEANY